MSLRTSEELAQALFDATAHLTLFALPKLMTELGLDARPRRRDQTEWEFVVLFVFCASAAATRAIPDPAEQQELLEGFFRRMAGDNELRSFLTDIRGRVDDYENRVGALSGRAAAAAAASLLHEKILPGEDREPRRLRLLEELYERMDRAYAKLLSGG